MTRSRIITKIIQAEGKIIRLKRERVRCQHHAERIRQINELKDEIAGLRSRLSEMENA